MSEKSTGLEVQLVALDAEEIPPARPRPARLRAEHLVDYLARIGEEPKAAPEMEKRETHRAYHRRTGCVHPEAIVGEQHHEFYKRTRRVHLQAKPDETIEQLCARTRKVRHDDVHIDGELKVIHCRSLKHEDRRHQRDEHDHRDALGVFDGTEMPIMVCNRCAHHDQVKLLGEMAKLKEAREALALRLGLSDVEMALLLPPDDLVEAIAKGRIQSAT